MSDEEWKQLEKLQKKAALVQSPGKDSEEFQLVTAPDHGAMTDGSKRRGDEEPSATTSKSQRNYSMNGLTVEGANHCVPLTSMSAGYVGPLSFPSPMPSEKPYAFDLPPGVPNVERWGSTVIEFGRYQGKNVTYEELFSNPDPVVQEYVQWASSRTKESHGLLSDLARYIQVVRKLNPVAAADQGPVIPGTQRVRRFR